ncbi:MADS-box protein SVP [Acorus gramineus]|uniref:MADS-box protein SVP n=1 Tax=Acorus gramineus TaxID=55184 RepID=A0AAV9BMB7_ACOGR|nr:MADS-box protein SVP [Acorus gramineus]
MQIKACPSVVTPTGLVEKIIRCYTDELLRLHKNQMESDENKMKNSEEVKKKKKGRKRKINIEYIEDKQSRHVAFTKRRKTIFKKAEDMIKEYEGSEIAVIFSSEAEKLYDYCSSSLENVIARYVEDMKTRGVAARDDDTKDDQ